MGDRILVVEDDETIAANLQRALTANGYETSRSSTGADAPLLALDVDLVLLDLGSHQEGTKPRRSLRPDPAGERTLRADDSESASQPQPGPEQHEPGHHRGCLGDAPGEGAKCCRLGVRHG